MVLGPLVAGAQVYQAGETTPVISSIKHWEVSLGWTHSNQRVQDMAGLRAVENMDGMSARGLYYPLSWLGIGAEGTWLNNKHFLGNSTYKDVRYGLISKWIITPDTKPAVYLLVGGGQREQKVNYVQLRDYTQHRWYVQGGVGVEVEIYGGCFVGAEGLMMYRAKGIDKFLEQNSRWERLLTIRGGVRF